MIHFAVGDQVVIRFGKQQGQRATIIKCQPAGVYLVRVEDGSVLCFTGKGLEKQEGEFRPEVR
jgi:hypothetical protein